MGLVQAQQLLLVIAGVGLIAITFVPTALIPICLVLAGFGLSGPQTLTNILFAEVADEDELRSGVRREGAFFGINALITKPAQSLAIALPPFILEAAHFITRESNNNVAFLNQPASAIFGIKVFIGLIPGIAMLLGALILFWFPLRGARLEKMQHDVLELHAQKKAKLEQQNA
jgi:GPH family glycoside/pentoside/hexuronide:cation symporter